MYLRIREYIIIPMVIGLIGIINIITTYQGVWVTGIKKETIGISIIIILLYYIINKWIISKKEIIIIINLIGILLFINNNKEIGIIYIVLELYTMTMYILINYNNKMSPSGKGGLLGENIYNNILYFFINSISSLILLLIISLIYYNYGIINIKDYIYINNTYLFYLLVFILLFKLGAYPFYYWLLMTYKELDIKIILLQSIFTKFIYLYFLFTLPIYNNYPLIVISIINLLIISILGINNNRLKEILILSSLLNLSFLIFASYSPILFFYYFILYTINTYLIVYFILYPYNFYLLLFFIFSLIGFPPFGGFFIKLFILFNSFNSSPTEVPPYLWLGETLVSYLFILIVLLSSILSANFYLKLINYFFVPPWGGPSPKGEEPINNSSYIITNNINNILIISFFSLFISFFYFYHPYYYYLLYYILY